MSSKKKLLQDIFQATYVANINGMIDENRYIRVLQSISENGFKTYHIDDFDRLAIYLKESKLYRSFIISILIYLRDENLRKIVEISRYFGEIRTIMSMKNKKMVERIHVVSKFLRDKMNIAKCFIKEERLESIFYGKLPGTQLSDERIREDWFYYNRQDIITRLHNLIDHFSLDQLRFIGVDLIRSDVLVKTNNVDLQNYYNRTINQIITAIKSWKRICLLYVDVDLNYLETCIDINAGREPKLKLKSFRIDIS